MPRCYYYPLNYARTGKKDIFANHFTENIYKAIHVNKTDKTMCYTLFFFVGARKIDSRLSSLIFSMVNQSQNVLILVLFEI